MNDRLNTSPKRKRVCLPDGSSPSYSRRDALARVAQLAGVGAGAAAWPSSLWAEETQEQTQRVGTARLTPEVRAAIKRGLAYLAKPGLQKEDGSWGGLYSVAFTSVALMAFMLEGNVPGRGRYGKKMAAGIAYLVAIARSQRGLLGTPGNTKNPMYEHGLAVLALSEAWGQSQNPQIRNTLRRAVDLILESQNREGGWRYKPDSNDADISVTIMQVVALMSAKESGIVVPQKTVDRAVEFLLRCHDPKSGGFNYQPIEPGAEANSNLYRTGGAVTCLMLCGKRRHPTTLRGVANLRAQLKTINSEGIVNPFDHYYPIQAMYQSGNADFQAWYSKVAESLVTQQKPDGSWNNAEHGIGSVFRASMAILVLGVPYRYLPIYQR
jgi:squalene cyclase